MIRNWIEYIKENVDPNSFNVVIYLRQGTKTGVSEQFWFYIKCSDNIMKAFAKNTSKYHSAAEHQTELISHYLFQELEVCVMDQTGDDNWEILTSKDNEYWNNLSHIFGDLSYMGGVFKGDRNSIISVLKSKDFNTSFSHTTSVGHKVSFKLVQVQLVELNGENDYDVIDYYL